MTMEVEKIKELVLSQGKTGTVNIPWTNIESLLEDNVDYPDKKKRFKMKLKPDLSEAGVDLVAIVGNDVRFNVKNTETKAQPKPIKKQKLVTPTISHATKDYLQLADDNPGKGTDFGHDYIFPPEFKFVKTAVENSICFPLLVGEASTGKSRMCEEIAKRLDKHDNQGNVIGKGRPVVRINLEEIIEEEDLVGCPQLITNPENGNSETFYVPGVLLEAWVSGWVLIMDELDRASSVARKQLNMVTEIGGRLMVKTHQGFKFFNKHPDSTFIFTANTWGHGDFTGMYDGAEPLNSAWLSRIGPKFELKLNWSVYVEALKQHNLDQKVINLLFEEGGGVVQTIHETIKNNNLQESVTLRSLIRFAHLYPEFGWHFGIETCFVNEFKEFNRERIRMIFARTLGNDLKPTDDFSIINSERAQSALREKGL